MCCKKECCCCCSCCCKCCCKPCQPSIPTIWYPQYPYPYPTAPFYPQYDPTWITTDNGTREQNDDGSYTVTYNIVISSK